MIELFMIDSQNSDNIEENSSQGENGSQTFEDLSNKTAEEIESILEEEGLGIIVLENEEDEEQQEIRSVLERSIKKKHHSLYSVPRNQDQFMEHVQKAISEISEDFSEEEIVSSIHKSCSLDCDCVVVGVMHKKIFHINTHLISDYNRTEVYDYLHSNTEYIDNLYSMTVPDLLGD